MNIEVSVSLLDVPVDTDVEDVAQTLQGAVNEWFYPEYTKTQPKITVTMTDPKMLMNQVEARPIYCISDLHLGDGGPRDNFLPEKEKQLHAFLDYVEQRRGELLILGDLFELWQANWSQVFTTRERLLDRFAAMGATYILGNHDADLYYFQGTNWINHPLFAPDRMVSYVRRFIGGRKFYFCHGHIADEYCSSLLPGLGRITAIYTGLREDRNGSPMLDKYRTVEQRSIGRMERLVSIFKLFSGKKDRFTEINRLLLEKVPGADVIVFGHTHSAGKVQAPCGRWLYNTGTWAERTCSFVSVEPSGLVQVWDWQDGFTPCERTLPI